MDLDYFFLTLFSFRERGREEEREKNIHVREKHRSVASCMAPTGDPAATQARALAGN